MVLLLALVYAKFIWNLPKPVNRMFLLAIGLFLGGAIGLEMVTALIHSASGFTALSEASADVNLVYSLVSTAEETLELIGATVLLYASLLYIKMQNVVAFRANF